VKQRILIAEDNPLNSELLRDWLELEGYEVLLVANLNAAFAAVRAEHPNVVLLDVQLGTEDGLALASWMRQQPLLCKIPIIAVTAQAMASEQQHILESGCNRIVPKPIDFAVLQRELQLCLSRVEVLQENKVPVKK
jgi:CheY-like chemotaxis protein